MRHWGIYESISSNLDAIQTKVSVTIISKMKTYRQILNQTDAGAVALDTFDHGFPDYMYTVGEGKSKPPVALIFLNLMRLEGAIVSNGFNSIFDQLIPPWELVAHEQFLEQIGAVDFCRYFKKCRNIYFGSCVPIDQQEWDELGPSIIYVNPNGPESMEFDKNAALAEEAFYGKNHDPSDYIDLHKKLGEFLKQNLASMLRPEDLDL